MIEIALVGGSLRPGVAKRYPPPCSAVRLPTALPLSFNYSILLFYFLLFRVWLNWGWYWSQLTGAYAIFSSFGFLSH